ncbi:MAG: glycosyltransferase [Candidatus Altiarchaeota archaeon]
MYNTILTLLFFFLSGLYISWIIIYLLPKKQYEKKFYDVSIVIPAHNEEKSIERTIKSILEAVYPKEKEVIVINDGSTDNTENILMRICKNHNEVKFFNTPHLGKAKALNFGIKKAKNEILLILDADSEIEKDGLTKICSPFSDKEVMAVGGVIRAKLSRNPLTWFQDLDYVISSSWRYICDKIDAGYMLPGFAAFRREALWKVCGFSTDTLSEDVDVGLKLRANGYRVAMSDATIRTKVPDSINGLIKQRIRWGRGGLQVLKKHKKLFFKNFRFLYGMGTQFYWYLHCSVYIPSILFSMISGYFTYFFFKNNVISIDVFRYFFSWLSAYGMIEYAYRVFTGFYRMDLYFIAAFTLFVLYLLYTFMMLIRFKYDMRNLFALFFYFPYTIFVSSLHTFPAFYDFLKGKAYNRWEKVE